MLLEITILPDNDLLTSESVIVSSVVNYTEGAYQKTWELEPLACGMSFLDEGEEVTEMVLCYLKEPKRFSLAFNAMLSDKTLCGSELQVRSVREVKDFPCPSD